jgi:hypothetical protein
MKYSQPTVLVLATFFTLLSACSSQPQQSEKTSEAELTDALGAIFGERKKPNMAELEKYPLGTPENPVRVAMPIGQRDYLARLVCNNDEQVSAFIRTGSAGIGPYGSMMDAYTVICDTDQGATEHPVFLDMYHADHEEKRPATGFKALLPARK